MDQVAGDDHRREPPSSPAWPRAPPRPSSRRAVDVAGTCRTISAWLRVATLPALQSYDGCRDAGDGARGDGERLDEPGGLERPLRLRVGDDAGYHDGSSTPTTLAASASPQPARFDITGLAADTVYHFRIISDNAAGYTLGPDATFRTAPDADVQAPTAPAGLRIAAETQTSLHAQWTGSSDNVGVAGYRVSEGATLLATVAQTDSLVSALQCGTFHTLSVVAFDAAGNTSPASTVSDSTSPCDEANLRYVGPAGSDANDGTIGHPFATIQHAVNAGTAGQTIYVRGGTYPPFAFYGSHGASGSPLTVAAYPGETPIVDGAGTPGNVIDIKGGASFVTVRGLQVQGGPADNNHAGVMVEGCSHDISIENALVTNNGAFGVRVYGSGCSGAMNVVVDGNTIQHNGTGIRLDYDSLGNKITGNELINNDRMLVNDATPGNDNGANAIQFYKTYGSTLVSGNVAHGNRATSHDYGYDGGAFEIFGASDLDIQGNVVWDNMNILETGTNCGRALRQQPLHGQRRLRRQRQEPGSARRRRDGSHPPLRDEHADREQLL